MKKLLSVEKYAKLWQCMNNNVKVDKEKNVKTKQNDNINEEEQIPMENYFILIIVREKNTFKDYMI